MRPVTVAGLLKACFVLCCFVLHTITPVYKCHPWLWLVPVACFPGSPHHNTALSINLQHLCINVSIQATYGYGWSTASFLLLSFTDIRSSFTNSSFRRLVFLGPSQLHVFLFFIFTSACNCSGGRRMAVSPTTFQTRKVCSPTWGTPWLPPISSTRIDVRAHASAFKIREGGRGKFRTKLQGNGSEDTSWPENMDMYNCFCLLASCCCPINIYKQKITKKEKKKKYTVLHWVSAPRGTAMLAGSANEEQNKGWLVACLILLPHMPGRFMELLVYTAGHVTAALTALLSPVFQTSVFDKHWTRNGVTSCCVSIKIYNPFLQIGRVMLLRVASPFKALHISCTRIKALLRFPI